MPALRSHCWAMHCHRSRARHVLLRTCSVVLHVSQEILNNNSSIWYSAASDTVQIWLDPVDDVISVGWRHGKKQADPRYRIDIDIGSLDEVAMNINCYQGS